MTWLGVDPLEVKLGKHPKVDASTSTSANTGIWNLNRVGILKHIGSDPGANAAGNESLSLKHRLIIATLLGS